VLSYILFWAANIKIPQFFPGLVMHANVSMHLIYSLEILKFPNLSRFGYAC